jgi:hypothetical protein
LNNKIKKRASPSKERRKLPFSGDGAKKHISTSKAKVVEDSVLKKILTNPTLMTGHSY